MNPFAAVLPVSAALLGLLLATSPVAALSPQGEQISQVAPPAGWSLERDGAVQVFRKTFGGQAMTLRVLPWAPLGGQPLTTWLRERWDAPLGPLAVTARTGDGPKALSGSDAGGGYDFAIVTRRLEPQGGSKMSSMLAACAREGLALVANLYGPPAAFAKRAVQREAQVITQTACATPPQAAGSPDQPGWADPRPQDAATRPQRQRPTFQRGEPPAGFERIWYIGDFVPGVAGMTARQKAVITFADKTVSDDIDTIFADGIAASKQRNPKDWGVWRINGEGELEIRWAGKDKFRDFYLTRHTDAGAADKRLEGCFSSRSGHSIGFGAGATHSFSVNTWCFAGNGRFSNDKAVSLASGGSGGPASAGLASSDSTGWYRIDGNVIQLVYDNGRRLTTSFAMMDEDDPTKPTDLLLGSGHYDE